MSIASRIILVLFIVVLLSELIFRRTEPNKLISYIDKGDWDGFDHEASSWRAAFYMNPYKLFCLKLNSYIIRDDKFAVKELLNTWNIRRMNYKKRSYVANRCFEYFVSIHDVKEARRYYDIIQELPDPKTRKHAEWVMDTYIRKKAAYLEQAKAEAESLPAGSRGELYTLISAMYANQHNQAEADRYAGMAKEELEGIRQDQ
jgi:hypothetical protein